MGSHDGTLRFSHRAGQPARLLEMGWGEKVVRRSSHGQLGEQENLAQPLCRLVLVREPYLWCRYPTFMHETFGNGLFMVAAISEAAGFVDLPMMIVCAVARYFTSTNLLF